MAQPFRVGDAIAAPARANGGGRAGTRIAFGGHMLRLASLAAVVLVAAAPAQAPRPFTPVRCIDAMGGWPLLVAMSPGGTVGAWASDANVVTCIAVADGRLLCRWQLPPGTVRRIAFVDEDHCDAWVDAQGGTPPSALRWSIAGGRVVGAAAAAPPAPVDLGPCRDRFRGDLFPPSRRLAAAAASRDDSACLGLWSSGHVTLLRGDAWTELVDADCRDVALSRDGRFVVAKLTTRVVVADADGDMLQALPVAVGAVAAVATGRGESEVAVVTATDVQLWDAPKLRLVRTFPLPVRGERIDVREACADRGRVVAVRAWVDGLQPWLGLLDLGDGSWRTFAFPHGSMAWSFDGDTLLVGTGGPADCGLESGIVRRVPRERGQVHEVATRGCFGVTALPDGGFFGVDSTGVVTRFGARRERPLQANVWGRSIAVSPDRLLLAHDGLVLRSLDGTEQSAVLAGPIDRLAIARDARRVVAPAGARLHVLQWRKAGGGRGRAW